MRTLRNSIIYLFLFTIFISCNQKETKNYLQYVDQLIGTGPSTSESANNTPNKGKLRGQTIIGVSAPFGMTQWVPQLHISENKCMSPFYYGSVYTQGFRASHWLNGSCTQDYGSFSFLPTKLSDEFKFLPDRRQSLSLINYDDNTPAYLSAGFPNQQLIAEVTGTKRCGFFRFTWMNPEDPAIMLNVNNDVDKGFIKIDLEKQEVYGYNPVERIFSKEGEPAGISGYFVAKFKHKIVKYGTYGNFDIEHGSTQRKNEREMGAYVSFKPENSESILMKVGTSFTSLENARKNLETEICDWNFRSVKLELENEWNDLLGKIEVETEDQEELTIFYTALYHALLHPRLFSDVNGDYPSFAQQSQINNTQNFDFYGDFMNRDIYRAQMPLVSLIAPKQYNDMVKSLVSMAKEGGWLPVSPMWNNYTSATTGDHGVAIIADAVMKGFEFNYEEAFEFLIKNAMETPNQAEYFEGKGRWVLEPYIRFGYIPLEEEPEDATKTKGQVSGTLEYAYNDWCVAQVADKLGKTGYHDNLISRSLNYTNVFDDSQGWMNGCYADGTFFEDFTPDFKQSFFSENTARQYSFYVPHDIPGLIGLMGENNIFSEKLDKMIDSGYQHSNVICQHIPYLYNYTGEWDKTQQATKKLIRNEYNTGTGGLPGKDNAGQLSAWYVFSAMGFYPVCPGSSEYQLSSPIFENVTLNLDKDYYPGRKFILQANPDGLKTSFNKVELNGKTISTSISHSDIQNGGILDFSNE
ncbi:MAG: GH92 family glycosyl hydrolase [Bacteroidota bacterium]